MITVRLAGGMGNQMFQYAVGRSLALKYNTSLLLDTTYLLDRTPRPNFTFRDYDLDVFCIQAKTASCFLSPIALYIDKIKNRIWKAKGVEKGFAFDKSILSLGPNVYLQGYWQSEKYFSEIKDTIRKDFSLASPLSQQSQTLLEEITQTMSVCIHVRRGDYVNNTFHDVGLGKSYYDKGLEYIAGKQAIEKIYVFSDDIGWCKNNLQFPFTTTFVGEEYAGTKGEGHIALMNACKHFIIPNSSFGWWGAWLSTYEQKIVVAPQRWFTDNTVNTNDITPPEWVRM
jgi:hypothetical protein